MSCRVLHTALAGMALLTFPGCLTLLFGDPLNPFAQHVSSSSGTSSSSGQSSSSSAAQLASSSTSSPGSSASSSAQPSSAAQLSSSAQQPSSSSTSTSGLPGETCANAVELAGATTLTDQPLGGYSNDVDQDPAGSWMATNCQATQAQGPDRVFGVQVPQGMFLEVQLSSSHATYDPVLIILEGGAEACGNVVSALRDCRDNQGAAAASPESSQTSLGGKHAMIIVDSAGQGPQEGVFFTLVVAFTQSN